MLDGIFIFDNAIHCYDLSDDNLREDREDAEFSRDLLLAMGAGGRWASYNDGSIEFKRRWTVEELYEMVFVDAPTDLAMVQVVPVFDWFKDTFAPVMTQHLTCTRSWRWRSPTTCVTATDSRRSHGSTARTSSD